MKKFRMISSHDSLRRKALAAIDDRISGLRLNETLSDDRELVRVAAFARRELRALRAEIRRLVP